MSRKQPPHPVTYLIKQIQMALRASLDEALAPLDLSTPELAVLSILDRTTRQTNAELARAAFVKPQSMTPILRTLEARGLVVRRPHCHVGRMMPTELTRKGRDRVLIAVKAIERVEIHLLSGLEIAEQKEFRRMLERCLQTLKSR